MQQWRCGGAERCQILKATLPKFSWKQKQTFVVVLLCFMHTLKHCITLIIVLPLYRFYDGNTHKLNLIKTYHLTHTKGNHRRISRGIYSGDCFRKVFVFMGQLSPKEAGLGRGPVRLVMITINSVYFPTSAGIYCLKPGQSIYNTLFMESCRYAYNKMWLQISKIFFWWSCNNFSTLFHIRRGFFL